MENKEDIRIYFPVIQIQEEERLKQSEQILASSTLRFRFESHLSFQPPLRPRSRRIINKVSIHRRDPKPLFSNRKSIQTKITFYYGPNQEEEKEEKEEDKSIYSIELNQIIEYMIQEDEIVENIEIDEKRLENIERMIKEVDKEADGRQET